MRRYISILLLLLAAPCYGATYYVATTGNDSTGTGTSGNPWLTISKGVGSMSGGDTLIVKNGTYSGVANFIGRNGATIPNGTAGQYTTIKAETPYGVRINRGSDSLGYYDALVYMEGSHYIEVEGFILDLSMDSADGEFTVYINASSYIKVKKCGIKRSGQTEQYNEVFNISASAYILVEDCSLVGNMRYGFACGGPGDNTSKVIFRRCVSRNDYSNSQQPKASFCVYGNNSTSDVRDVLYQNCIAIDSQDTGPTSSERVYGAFYNPKNATNVTYRGCIALNVDAYHSAMFVKELGGANIRMDNCVVWDSSSGTDSGIRFNSTGDNVVLNQCTVGGNPRAFHNSSYGSNHILTNSLIYGNTAFDGAGNGSWTSVTYNYFSPSSQSTDAGGTNSRTTGIDLKYILRVESDSTTYGGGDSGANQGASVLYKIGTDNTLWGDSGYNDVTANSLWPFPLESNIKSLFSETNTPPALAGYRPTTNNTTRGFCSDTSLTNYIWNYLGNGNPYSTAASGAKGNLRGTIR